MFFLFVFFKLQKTYFLGKKRTPVFVTDFRTKYGKNVLVGRSAYLWHRTGGKRNKGKLQTLSVPFEGEKHHAPSSIPSCLWVWSQYCLSSCSLSSVEIKEIGQELSKMSKLHEVRIELIGLDFSAPRTITSTARVILHESDIKNIDTFLWSHLYLRSHDHCFPSLISSNNYIF